VFSDPPLPFIVVVVVVCEWLMPREKYNLDIL
jgi:hypothetical protein